MTQVWPLRPEEASGKIYPLMKRDGDFPGGPVVKTRLRLHTSNAGTLGLIPGQDGLSGKNSTYIAGDTEDMGSIPRSGRSPEGRHGNPLQYSCLKNPMDG